MAIITQGYGLLTGRIVTQGYGIGVTPPVPTPETSPEALGLLERSGREGGFLVPPMFVLPVIGGRFSKELSDPWEANPYEVVGPERERLEIEELCEVLDLIDW